MSKSILKALSAIVVIALLFSSFRVNIASTIISTVAQESAAAGAESEKVAGDVYAKAEANKEGKPETVGKTQSLPIQPKEVV